MTDSVIQLGAICGCLAVGERDARYVLEKGFVPSGIEKSPTSGNHRQFGPRQAFWLAMVLKLKATGIKTPLAARIADFTEQSMRTITQSYNWGWQFRPWEGLFDTEHQCFVDVGDLTFLRLVTDGAPGGSLRELDWVTVAQPRRQRADARPFVIVRLDLTRLAEALARAFSKSNS